MLDVDWFKQYNDCYGHPAGDDCLRQIAQVLQEQARRAGDLVARYGGEEFAFIAPEMDALSMLRLASTMRESLQALRLPHANSALGRVTISLGVAVLVPAIETTPEALLRIADAALYRAKARGRNRTVLVMNDPKTMTPVSSA